MTSVTQRRVAPAMAVRAVAWPAAAVALGAALFSYASGATPLGDDVAVVAAALLAVGILTRRFGIPLPGGGYAAYTLGVVLYAVLDGGWAFATLLTPIAVLAGDRVLRRLSTPAALDNAAHLTFAAAVVGLLYKETGGAPGTAAFGAANLFPLAALVVLLGLMADGTRYLQLALRHTRANLRLMLRWEAIVYGATAVLALAWRRYVEAGLSAGPSLLVFAALLTATLGSNYVLRQGVRAAELSLIQVIARALVGDADLRRAFGRLQELTHTLVPWEQMGVARYDAESREMVVLIDTGLPAESPELRFDPDAGLSGEAIRLREPAVGQDLRDGQVVLPPDERPGSEVVVPLYHGGSLVGAWNVRHSAASMFHDPDGELLGRLAPQLALLLAIEHSVAPVAGASERAARYAEALTTTTERVRASGQEAGAAARRAGQGATDAIRLVASALRESEELQRTTGSLVDTGDDTQDSGERAQSLAESVQLAARQAMRRLTDLSVTAEESANEVQRIREVASQVEKFSETIGFIANQTNLLALNATIEAARAGVHGRGFSVVADEVHKLAEESSREARNVGRSVQESRRALERAAQLLEEVRKDLTNVVEQSGDWLGELGQISETAAAGARAGKRIADAARANADLCTRVAQSLGEARTNAEGSAAEVERFTTATSEQLRAVEGLAGGAAELAALAERLTEAFRFLRGGNGRR